MTRDECIKKLKAVAPIVVEVVLSQDMGYEFSAIVPDGVIYAEPGMLLNEAGGEWPPEQWKEMPDEERDALLKAFLLDKQWKVVVWDDLSNGELTQWLEAVKRTKFQSSKAVVVRFVGD